MKSIVNSQLTGKWYLIAQTYNRDVMRFVDVFIYLSIGCTDCLDLLYVAIKEDRSKVLRKFSLKLLTYNDEVFVSVKNAFFSKKLKLLTFDRKNELMIVADEKMKNVSIFSRKSHVRHEMVEKALNEIDFSKSDKKEVELFSDKIFF